MIGHAVVNGAEIVTFFLSLIDSSSMRSAFRYSAEVSMAQPFGLYWGFVAWLIWTHEEPTTTATEGYDEPDDFDWWQEATKITMWSYAVTAVVFSAVQIWTMPAIRDWEQSGMTKIQDVGGLSGNILGGDGSDYESGDFVM